MTQDNTLTAEELASQSVLLTDLVSYFMLNKNGTNTEINEIEKQMEQLKGKMEKLKKNPKSQGTTERTSARSSEIGNNGISIEMQQQNDNEFVGF